MFNPEHPMITSGPFIFSDFDAGEFYELTRNPDYYYRYEPAIHSTPTPTTTTGTNDLSPTLVSLTMAASVCIILVIVVEVVSSRKLKS